MKLLAVVTTVATREDADRIARAMVEQRLAACVQVSGIESHYRWEGGLQHEPEFRLLLKTTEAAWPALEAALLALHPYDVPALYAVPVEHASAAYADWVAAEADGGARSAEETR
jgi:periplasmic divalent cation tolerance protein